MAQALAGGGARADTDARGDFALPHTADLQARFMYFDALRYLPGDLLTKVDRASMAVSLEAREPFLDHPMAEAAFALPSRWKIRDGQGKVLLRRLLDRHFPAGLFDRPKHGFSAPVKEWLRGPLKERLRFELSEQQVRQVGLLDPKVVTPLLDRFLAGGSESTAAGIWFLFQLQRWGGRWLNAPVVPR
jgi:asparagine synthase (glutamine-hydrolysing)